MSGFDIKTDVLPDRPVIELAIDGQARLRKNRSQRKCLTPPAMRNYQIGLKSIPLESERSKHNLLGAPTFGIESPREVMSLNERRRRRITSQVD
ncbi:MAG TPA: hypothetical protein VG271_19470, partial [Beijerinckiaceae bacterium]|nr:hypothetical protein [Beijerinckiaceae bacterium]